MIRISGLLALLCAFAACSKPTGPAAPVTSENQSCTYVSGPDFANHKACYKVKKGVNGPVPVYQGDIKLAKSVVAAEARRVMRERGRRATSLSNSLQDYFWPGGTIPYTIEGASLTASVEDSLDDLEIRSGVRFIPRTNQADYIAFVAVESDEYCGISYLGQIGGKQEIEINVAAGTNCRTRRVIQHETMHALGFWHEQSRNDRDDFVRILWEHIIPGFEDQFDKMPSSADGVGPYDFGSVMHYDRDAFSWDGQDTIQADTEAHNALIGTATQASEGDVKAIQAIYGAAIRVTVAYEGENTEKAARFTYTTTENVASAIKIGANPDDLETQSLDDSAMGHEVEITGLAPKTRYFYKVLLASSPEVWSQTRSFLTDVTPPQIIDPRLHAIAGDIAEVRFSTNENTEGYLLYFEDVENSDSFLGFDLAFGKIHNVKGYLGQGNYVLVPIAVDEAGNETYGDPISAHNDSLAPTISHVAVTGLTATGATISWDTDEDSSTIVLLGTSADALTAHVGTGNTKEHSLTLTSLTANTIYYYKVKSVDAAGNAATSALATFSTDLVAPTISGVSVTGLTYTGATIVWMTNEAADSKVLWGTSCESLSQNSYDAAKVTSHSRTLTGLSPGTSYCFKVISKDATGNEAASATQTFSTPVIPVATISNVSHSLGTSSAVVTWTTSLGASSYVEYGAAPGTYSNNVAEASFKTSHSLTLSNLTPGLTYYYRVRSTTPEGGVATSAEYSFAISNVDTVSSIYVLYFWQNGIYLPRWVKASSSNPREGVTQLTLKVVDRSTGAVWYSTRMNYLFQENNYNAELPYYVAYDLSYYRQNLQIKVESSLGGSATWSY